MVVVKVLVAVAIIAIGEVLLEGLTAVTCVACGLEGTVVVHCRHFGCGEALLQVGGRVRDACGEDDVNDTEYE